MRAADLVLLAVFAAVMAVAAFEDFRRLVIPNPLVLALCVLWLPHAVLMGGATPLAAIDSVAVALAAFAAGMLLFAAGLVGGGDVKLFAAAALWTGADRAAQLLSLTALFGGGLAVLVLSPLGGRPGAAGLPQDVEPTLAASRRPVPYGVAIAAAALAATLPTQFG